MLSILWLATTTFIGHLLGEYVFENSTYAFVGFCVGFSVFFILGEKHEMIEQDNNLVSS